MKKVIKLKESDLREMVQRIVESKRSDSNYEVYHDTYTSAINGALDYAEKKGYEYDKDETFTKIGTGPRKPTEGETNRFNITLFKDGKEQKKMLHIQVYGMNKKYELNCYIN